MSKSKRIIRRGELLLAAISYLSGTQTVRRPVLVVCDPTLMLDLIVTMISSRIRSPLPPTHYLIDPTHRDWSTSCLAMASVVRTDRIYTLDYDDIAKPIGTLSGSTMREIDPILKRALGIP